MKISWSDKELSKMTPAGKGLHRVKLLGCESKQNKAGTGLNAVYDFVVDDAEDKDHQKSITLIRPMGFLGLHADMHSALFGMDIEQFQAYCRENPDYDTDELVGKTAYVMMKNEINAQTQENVLRDKDWYADRGERPPVE